MKLTLKILLFFIFTNTIAQNKVVIENIALTSETPGYINLNGPQYDGFIIVEIWNKKNWRKYSKSNKSRTDRKTDRNTIYRKQGNNCKGAIQLGMAVKPGKYVLHIIFDYNDKAKMREYVKTLDTRKSNK